MSINLDLVGEEDAAYDVEPLPMSQRRGPVSMGLLWVTMVTSLPMALIGFEWFKSGFSLKQVLLCTTISCIISLAYAIPATQLGARSGLGYIALSRRIFGQLGTRLIAINLILMYLSVYGLFALMCSGALKDLFHWSINIQLLVVVFTLLMSLNNFFGFTGVVNFARYFAAPAIIIWVFYSFYRAACSCPPIALFEPSHVSFSVALTSISSFALGYAIWGNEADYWRFGKPKVIYSIIPLALSFLVGQIIFPITGWMIAKSTGISDYSAATSLMTSYSCGGITLLTALILAASYFAAADPNLYAAIEAGENLVRLRHRTWVCIWTGVATCIAIFMTNLGELKSIESLLSLSCILIPAPTIIMMTEWFLMVHIFHAGSTSTWSVPSFKALSICRWPATIALLAGITIGVATSGVIPGTEKWKVGICAIQAWLTSLIIYVSLRIVEYKRDLSGQRLVLEKILSKESQSADTV